MNCVVRQDNHIRFTFIIAHFYIYNNKLVLLILTNSVLSLSHCLTGLRVKNLVSIETIKAKQIFTLGKMLK